jgi:hypothetical protein
MLYFGSPFNLQKPGRIKADGGERLHSRIE